MNRLNPYEVHDKVIGQCRMVLDTYQIEEIQDYDALVIGVTATKYNVTVYFNDNTKMNFRRNY